jgi:predicted dehydrogenase
MADRSNGNTLMTSPGGHSIDVLCFCLGEFKELASVVGNQRQRVKIVEMGEMIQMTSPDQVLMSGVLQSGAAELRYPRWYDRTGESKFKPGPSH